MNEPMIEFVPEKMVAQFVSKDTVQSPIKYAK